MPYEEFCSFYYYVMELRFLLMLGRSLQKNSCFNISNAPLNLFIVHCCQKFKT